MFTANGGCQDGFASNGQTCTGQLFFCMWNILDNLSAHVILLHVSAQRTITNKL